MKRRFALGGRLDRYVLAHFVSCYVLAACVLVGLFVIVDASGNVEKWMEASDKGPPATLVEIASFYLMSLPYILLQVGPFVTLMASMFTVNKLLKKNELSPILSAGVSAHRMLLPVYLGAVLLGLGMVGLREACGRWVAMPRDALHAKLTQRHTELLHRGVIVRHLDGSWAIFDEFRPLPPDGGGPSVTGLTVRLRRDGEFTKVEADEARWDGRGWSLQGGLRTELIHGEDVASTEVDRLPGLELHPDLVETYRRARATPMELTFGEVDTLLHREPDKPAWATLWHYHLTFALANLILVLVGVPLMLSHERRQGAERLALGGLLCVFYFALDFVLRTLGLNGSLSPVLASWIPVLLFGSLGIFLTDSMQT
ncbi:MAG: LptF/LptG family permease [Planctomycetota bacterium]|nr:LptF/LptG family permease [Planctomycetota bacterium]